MRKPELREVGLFFLGTIALSYFVFWGPIAALKVPAANLVGGTRGPLWAIILFILGGFVPSITGIILTAVFEGKEGMWALLKSAFQVDIGVRWYAVILSVALYFAFSLIAICTLLGGKFDYAQFWLQLPTILPLVILGPLSEEYGWRGFATKRLLKHLSANAASLAVGLVWALWHLPLFFMLGTSQREFHIPFLAFLVSVTSISFIYTYVYLRTKQSLFAAVFLHWTYTYVLQVVSSSVVRSIQYNWLESVPAVLIGLAFAFLLRNERAATSLPQPV
jgi:membrane protease YdiL (CAAX protease family)